jgi:SP family sugar:H+ symporter-like MFS transporter
VSPSQSSLVVSILSAGTFFGALTAAPFADFMGRRIALLVSAGVVFNFGVILQTASTALPMFIAGRFFAGFGVGLISALSKSFFVPRQYLYLSDCCGRDWTCG